MKKGGYGRAEGRVAPRSLHFQLYSASYASHPPNCSSVKGESFCIVDRTEKSTVLKEKEALAPAV